VWQKALKQTTDFKFSVKLEKKYRCNLQNVTASFWVVNNEKTDILRSQKR
jgi:hypothetical protein